MTYEYAIVNGAGEIVERFLTKNDAIIALHNYPYHYNIEYIPSRSWGY